MYQKHALIKGDERKPIRLGAIGGIFLGFFNDWEFMELE